MGAVRFVRDQCAANGIAFHHKRRTGVSAERMWGALVDGVEAQAYFRSCACGSGGDQPTPAQNPHMAPPATSAYCCRQSMCLPAASLFEDVGGACPALETRSDGSTACGVMLHPARRRSGPRVGCARCRSPGCCGRADWRGSGVRLVGCGRARGPGGGREMGERSGRRRARGCLWRLLLFGGCSDNSAR